MLLSSHDWPCKLLLMCHWLELFIERDELGHEGAEFDLWQCIWGLKTPPHWELHVFVHGIVLLCVCVCVFVESVHLPREYNTSQQTQRLLCSFEAPWMKKLSWEKSINQESCCQKHFFPPFDGPRTLSSCAFNLTFFIIWLHSFQDKPTNHTGGGGAASVILSILVFIFLPFTISHLQCLINPRVALPCCITFSTAAAINLLSNGSSQFQPSIAEK